MAAMMLSASCTTAAVPRGGFSRRSLSSGRIRTAPGGVGRRGAINVRATISKDNVFANSPRTLNALNNLNARPATLGGGVNTNAPFASEDVATMPHRERLKVFSGSAHPELSDVRTHHDDPFAKKIRLGVRFRDVAPTPVPRRARALSRASTKARSSASAFARAIRRARPLLERRGSRRDARGKTRPPDSKFRSPLKTPFPNRALADEAADDRAKRKLGRFGPRL